MVCMCRWILRQNVIITVLIHWLILKFWRRSFILLTWLVQRDWSDQVLLAGASRRASLLILVLWVIAHYCNCCELTEVWWMSFLLCILLGHIIAITSDSGLLLTHEKSSSVCLSVVPYVCLSVCWLCSWSLPKWLNQSRCHLRGWFAWVEGTMY